jgi:hypothetical protein
MLIQNVSKSLAGNGHFATSLFRQCFFTSVRPGVLYPPLFCLKSARGISFVTRRPIFY